MMVDRFACTLPMAGFMLGLTPNVGGTGIVPIP